jgi:hypothetical protein
VFTDYTRRLTDKVNLAVRVGRLVFAMQLTVGEAVMELSLHSHHFTHRMPDRRAAVWAGLFAGFLVLGAFLMAVVTGQDPRVPPNMIAAIILGRVHRNLRMRFRLALSPRHWCAFRPCHPVCLDHESDHCVIQP